MIITGILGIVPNFIRMLLTEVSLDRVTVSIINQLDYKDSIQYSPRDDLYKI